MADLRRLSVPARIDNIPSIVSFVAQAAEAAGFGETDVFHCQMAADEACTNIVEHAYTGQEDGPIDVVCEVTPGDLTIWITDSGQRFDPTAVPEPDLANQPVDELEPGGIGLHLMRKMVDEVEFTFEEGQNRLRMRKQGEAQFVAGPEHHTNALTTAGENICVVLPSGRLDSGAAPEFEATLRELISQGKRLLVVDLENVSYISSRGLKALLVARRLAAAEQGRMVLSGMRPNVQEVFRTVGFLKVFDAYTTRNEAVAALSDR